MDAKERQAFAAFLLIAGTLLGLVVRLAPAMLIGVPINDGGMFYQATLDLEANGLRLPLTISYNHLQLPFAYPPLGFYITALIHSITRADLYRVFQLWPGVASTLSIPSFYFLATPILQDKTRAAVAASFYALAPASFYLPFMGGGVTRAPALAFSLLALGYLYRMFVTGERRYAWPAAGLLALTGLTHPETLFHTVISAALFWLMAGRTWKSLTLGGMAVGAAALIAAPWWIMMLERYGPAPYLIALGSNLRDAAALLYLLQFNMTGEAFLTVIGVLAAIGLWVAIKRREWLLPVWVLISFATSMRASPFSAIFGVSMLAAIGTERLVGQRAEAFEALYSSKAKRNILLLLVAYNFMAGLWAASAIAYEQRMLPQERAFLSQVSAMTSSDSRFLVLTGASGPSDALAEWFPALTQRVSVATIQGHEWTSSPSISQAYWQSAALQACVNNADACLGDWSAKFGQPFDYVYVRKIRTLRTGATSTMLTPLELSLRQDPSFEVLAESSVGVVFKHK